MGRRRGFKKFMRKLRHSIQKAAPILSAVSKVASVVPGVGTAAAMGLGAAAAAARGEKLSRVLGAGLTNAIPGVSQAATAIETARALGAGRMLRNMRAPDPARALRKLPALRSVHRTTDTVTREVLRRAPQLLARNPSDIARSTGLSARSIERVLQHGAPLAWMPLTRRAAGLVQRLSSVSPYHYSRDVGGLSTDGLTYTVETGDYPAKIAGKLTGDQNRWRELVAANPQKKKDPKTGNFKTLYAGEVLTLPSSWVKPVSQPTLSSAVVLKSKGIMAAWGKTDGANSAGPSDYGFRPEDVTSNWTDRDRLQLKAFEFWSKMADQSGTLTQAAVDALQRWAEAAVASPPATPATQPDVVFDPDVITSTPSDVPQLPAPTTTPTTQKPPVVSLPIPGIPQLPAPTTMPSDVPQLPAPTTTPTMPPNPTASQVMNTSSSGDPGALLGVAAAAIAALLL